MEGIFFSLGAKVVADTPILGQAHIGIKARKIVIVKFICLSIKKHKASKQVYPPSYSPSPPLRLITSFHNMRDLDIIPAICQPRLHALNLMLPVGFEHDGDRCESADKKRYCEADPQSV